MSLSHSVECDEVYVKAGHKGNPMAVASAGRQGRCRALQGAPGRGTLAKDKPPIFGRSQRCGDVVSRMLENVRQATIEPLIRQTARTVRVGDEAKESFDYLLDSGANYVVVLNADDTIAGIVTKTSVARSVAENLWGDSK